MLVQITLLFDCSNIPEPAGKNRYNLKNSITQYLNSKPGDNTLADAPLTFTATGPGLLVTVYAPVIK
ncbi:MAG: hypothetical protein J7K30_15230 [Deltaproteobacteria bacterium]|nr:hypothetical protein [Deltaproteobacteria bacterium]